MRIIRVIVILGGLAIVLPLPPAQDGGGAADPEPDPGLLERAATGLTGATGLCDDLRLACSLTAMAAARLDARLAYSAALLQRLAQDALREAPQTDVAAPHRIVDPATLRLDDMLPAWRGPAP